MLALVLHVHLPSCSSSWTKLTPGTLDSVVSKRGHDVAPVVDDNAAARANGVDL